MDYKPRERISNITRLTMIFVAIFFWLASFIPIAEWVIVPSGWIVFWIWFKINGGGLIKKPGSEGFTSSLVLRILSFMVGFIPEVGVLVSAFPLVIYTNIRCIEKEDKEFNVIQMKNLQQSQPRSALQELKYRTARNLKQEPTRPARSREPVVVQ